MTANTEIRANSVLPARREAITLRTADGLQLVGEFALPLDRPARAAVVMVHPLPTHGGMMDSHLFRKAAWRLPALADLAVLRFNTRGTSSVAGTSEGQFDEGRREGLDLQAAVDAVVAAHLPTPWAVGWSFGTDVVLKHPEVSPLGGAFLISPPVRFSDADDLRAWQATGLPVTCLIPEFDDYLKPEQARERFADLPNARLVVGEGGKHLWVGEPATRFVLNELVRAVTPEFFDQNPAGLPNQWDGPIERWNDL